ncbi:hypothetical protein [Streptomonospora wellingtoniae]|uniref:Uncharacterized protein n=1 Tax=Streptomonospora wellingtoniae TaxID=3075544 RepID=A0ABU2L0B6_9ACTN|nr:hypothetical protein [Streptomonospora sp. DSM 45055]MDT0304852.1 hypothetical protein [Streptomonospora sp. DSM 45055]
MSADDHPALPLPSAEYGLTETERRALCDLLDELVEATEDRVFWFGRAREAALEIKRRLDTLLTDGEV